MTSRSPRRGLSVRLRLLDADRAALRTKVSEKCPNGGSWGQLVSQPRVYAHLAPQDDEINVL